MLNGKFDMNMKSNYKLILINLLILGTFGSCSNDTRLKVVKVIFGPEYATVNVPISCSSIEYDLIGIKKKRIEDANFLKELENEVQNLKVDSENSVSDQTVDVRIKCFLEYQSKVDTLCLGEFNGVIYNGKLMINNEGLIEMVKSNIYSKQ